MRRESYCDLFMRQTEEGWDKMPSLTRYLEIRWFPETLRGYSNVSNSSSERALWLPKNMIDGGRTMRLEDGDRNENVFAERSLSVVHFQNVEKKFCEKMGISGD